MPSSEICVIGKTKGYSDGYVRVLGNILFFRTWGEPGPKGTVLCLHGGIGTCDPYSYLAKLTEDGYRVVVYDQLGCSRSERPQDISLYNMEHYVEEVDGIRRALNLGKVHLFGASWGGFLNIAYAVKYSKNLRSLIISSGSSSYPLYINELAKQRRALPKAIQQTLTQYEKRGEYRNPEYLEAMRYYFRKHAFRLDHLPLDQQLLYDRVLKEDRIFGRVPNPLNRFMSGESFWSPNGSTRYWDVTDQLGNIDVPTLIICGEYDQVSPECSKVLHKGIKNSELVIFKNMSHVTAREAPQKFVGTIQRFLESISS